MVLHEINKYWIIARTLQYHICKVYCNGTYCMCTIYYKKKKKKTFAAAYFVEKTFSQISYILSYKTSLAFAHFA